MRGRKITVSESNWIKKFNSFSKNYTFWDSPNPKIRCLVASLFVSEPVISVVKKKLIAGNSNLGILNIRSQETLCKTFSEDQSNSLYIGGIQILVEYSLPVGGIFISLIWKKKRKEKES